MATIQDLMSQLRTGQSRSSVVNDPSNAPQFPQSSFTGPGPSPQQVIDTVGGVAVNRYPLSDNQPYKTMISISQYQRTNWASIGKTKTDRIISLPMPMNITDVQEIKYSTEPLGLAGAAAMSLGGPLAQALMNGNVSGFNNATDGATNQFKGSAGLLAAEALAKSSTLAKQATQGLLQAAGFAMNNFLTVCLEGPAYKSRDFSWKFSPNSAAETRALADILRLLGSAQAPALSPGSTYAFWQWPSVIDISFQFKGAPIGDVLFYMKPMVITNLIQNFTPDQIFAPYRGTNGPNAVELSIKLMELEFWLNSAAGAYDAYNVPPNSRVNSAFDALGNQSPTGDANKASAITIRPITGG